MLYQNNGYMFLSNSEQFYSRGAAVLDASCLWALVLHRVLRLIQILHLSFQHRLLSPKASSFALNARVEGLGPRIGIGRSLCRGISSAPG